MKFFFIIHLWSLSFNSLLKQRILTVLPAKRATCDNVNHRLLIFILLALLFTFSHLEYIIGVYTQLMFIKRIMVDYRSLIIGALHIDVLTILFSWEEISHNFFFSYQIYIFLFQFFINHFHSRNILLRVKVQNCRIVLIDQFIDDNSLLACWYLERVISR